MKKLTLSPLSHPSTTEIHFEFDPEICLQISKRGAILADAQILKTYGAAIQNALGYELIPVPKEKTREAKQALEDELFKRKLGKDSVIVAVGGGATTDLVGFLASTYMRGVPLVLIPTTLLAMVDAAIGGKTAIDTPFGKNLVGSLYLPRAVLIDLRFLKSLPPIEMKNGLSEILKYGLIQDAGLWQKCEHWEDALEELIRASIACKIKVVEQDFEEKTGLRRILNFGHTVGHALELISGFKMPHGEAVALGCMAESYLSHLLGYLPTETFKTILHLYQKIGYAFKKFDVRAFHEAMALDKKAKGGIPRFVLIDQIGHCVPFDGAYCTSIQKKELDQMVEWMEHG